MSECVEKMPHECGSRQGLQVFEKEDGTYDGYCFNCRTYVHDPYKDKPVGYIPPPSFSKTPEQVKEELTEIAEFPTVDLPERKLKKEYLDYFEIKIGLSESDGVTPASHHYPYRQQGVITAYKNRIIENKNMWSTGDQKDVDLFGWDQAASSGAKRLIITEGELDAVALFQVLKDSNKGGAYADYNPAVVSLPHGAASAGKDIARLATKIRATFKEVVLAFDGDEAGSKAQDDVMRICPDFLAAHLPSKDANAALMEGRSKALKAAVMFQAAKPKNTRLVYGSSLREAARQEAEWGLSYPWPGLTELTRGLRFGETIYVGAGVKMGKSEVVNALGAWFMKEHDLKIFMAKPEEANRKTYQMLVGKMANRIFHDPKIPFDYAAYDAFEPMVGDKVVMVNLYQHLGWETLKGDITAAAMEGHKIIFIDPITNLTNSMSPSDANTALTQISSELAAMALDLDLAIFIFCHLKAPSQATPHEMGGKIYSNQFAGSRSMMRSCNYMIGLEGNKDDEQPIEERNKRDLVVLEDREFGNVGRVPLFWDKNTGAFNEIV